MTQTLFLLGAGFNRDAFSETKEVELASLQGTHTKRIEYPLLADAWGICFPNFNPKASDSIEERLHTALETGDEKPIERLCEHIMRCDYYLSQQLLRMHKEQKHTCYGKLIKQFPNAHFLTFNYDSLLEILLLQLRRWNPQDGYGVSVEAIPVTVFGKEKDKSEKSQNIVIHLHGTLCLYESDVDWDSSSEIPLLKLKETPVFKFDPASIGHRFPNFRKANLTLGDDVIGIHRRVVAPVPDKSLRLKKVFIKTMYAQAINLISSARQIVSIGYDFNPNDRSSYEPLLTAISLVKKADLFLITPNANAIHSRLSAQYPSLSNRMVPIALTLRQWAESEFHLHKLGLGSAYA